MPQTPQPPNQTGPEHIGITLDDFQSLSQLDPIWTSYLRPAIVVLSLITTFIGIAGFVAKDPLYGSVMISIAIAFLASCKLMFKIPETFRIIWNRNIQNSGPSDSTPTGKFDLSSDDSDNSVSVNPEAFATFMQKFSARLTHRIQWFISIGVSLTGVISWRLIYLLKRGSFFHVEPYCNLCRNLGPTPTKIVEFSAFISEIAIGILVGLIAWRMLVLGRYISLLNRNFVLKPNLLHPDRVGGLKPLGDLCLLNVMILTIPSINLAIWIFSAPIFYENRYGDQYTNMLLIILLATIASAFFVLFYPLQGVHRVMVEARAKIIPLVEKLYNNIENLSDQLLVQAAGKISQETDKMAKKVALLQQVYQDYQHLPVWPFRFRVLFLQQAVPILGFLIGLINIILRLIEYYNK